MALLCAVALTGCATMENGRGWGEDATIAPNGANLWRALKAAATDPHTWLPAAGAAVFAADGLDRKVSNWASENTPVFGTGENARNASDALVDAAEYSAYATALITPSGSDPAPWAWRKAKGLAVIWAAGRGTDEITNAAKEESDRERPDATNDRSFPSGHSSRAFAFAAAGRKNVDAMNWGENGETAAKISIDALAVGTAWARVEGKKHYPSDVLAGAALGNFISSFAYDAFINAGPTAPRLTVTPLPGGGVALVSASF